MFKRARDRMGTAGLAVAVVALVFAMIGGAYAASGGLTSKQKKQTEAIAKKYAGKNGQNGAPGSTGPIGPPGTAGAQGLKGDPGAAGKSVKVKAKILPGTAKCNEQGGVVYEIEGSGAEETICNGAEGAEGPEGKPWTAGGTLPPGATETGYWTFSAPPAKIKVDVEGTTKEITLAPEQGIYAPISFPIKLPFALKAAHVHYGEPGSGGAFEPTGACPSTTALTPEAKPGELCVYEGYSPNAAFVSVNKLGISGPGASVAGAVIRFSPSAAEGNEGVGSYAVTSCEEGPGTSECKP